jgi:hypothetical protein
MTLLFLLGLAFDAFAVYLLNTSSEVNPIVTAEAISIGVVWTVLPVVWWARARLF